jgi:protocatechuate 3,4-dioxygenase beta subunit
MTWWHSPVLAVLVATMFAPWLTVQQPAPSPPPAAAGSVAGMVLDTNGRPMPRMVVRLRRVLDANRSEILPYSSLSDAAGRYVIIAVPPGEYLVESLREGTREPSTYYPSALPYNPGGFWPKGASRITVAAGQPVTGIDISFSRRRITGRVVDSSGQPMPSEGAEASGHLEGRVILNRVGVSENPSGNRPGADGRFQFDNLEPGEYVLRTVVYAVRPCEHCISNVAREFALRTLVVGGSDVEAVDVQLQRATTLRGRIVLENGQPLDAQDLRMTVSQQALPREIRANQDTMLEHTLNRDGTFEIHGVVAAIVIGVQNTPARWHVKSISLGTPRRPDEAIPPDTREEIVVVLSAVQN